MSGIPHPFSAQVDAWSVGCVALELLLGRQWFSDHWLPFSKLTERPHDFEAGLESALDALDRELLRAVPDSVPGDAASFLRAALTRDPDDRPAVERLAAHAWISRRPHLNRLSRNVDSTGDLASTASDGDARD